MQTLLRNVQFAEQWPLKRPIEEGEKERVALGIYYREERPTWEEQIPQIATTPLVKQSIQDIDINPLFDELM